MLKKYKKLLSAVLISSVLVFQNVPYVMAQEVTETPAPTEAPAPTNSPAPTNTPEPTTAVAAVTETPAVTPTPTMSAPASPSSPSAPSAPNTTMTSPAAPAAPSAPDMTNHGSTNVSPAHTDYTYSDGSTTPSATTNSGSTGSQVSTGGSGSVSMVTGDANSNGNISTVANTNTSIVPSAAGSGSSTVVNSGNGTDSNNGSSSTSNNTVNNNQTNSANVGNNLNSQSQSGNNILSENTGGDVNLTTGDSNTSGTIVNSVNTNLNGVAVYEFNIADDHLGDYVLDFSNANCVSGCGTATPSAVNTGNGAGSNNTATSDTTNTTNNNQTNDANLVNNLNLGANSGDNTSMKNTGGDTNITTGDANVQGSVLNFANNNVEGGVVYAVVNVYGDLTGDIILPESALTGCCNGSPTAVNSGNGANSTNNATASSSNTDNTNQFNNVNIDNNLVFDAQTGDNIADKNTDGNVNVDTGDTNVVAQVLNVANTNVDGGNWWLVIVNEAGKWIGRIVGSPDGQNYAGSEGFEITVADDGSIMAADANNGAGSANTASTNETNTTNTTQTNNANIVNNVNLSANTGGNNASKNTNGDSSVKTGDANIVANIVNFVNNNITGGGKLFVTVVNVFGSWLGDFVAPGQHKDAENNGQNNQALGGVSESPAVTQNTVTTSYETPTPKKQSRIAYSKAISNVSANEGNGGKGLVLGIADNSVNAGNTMIQSNEVTAAGKKVIRINLAWLTLLLPLGLFYLIRRRKLALAHTAARNK